MSSLFTPLELAVAELHAAGARYGEARCVDRLQEWLEVRNDRLDRAWTNHERGIGVRALVGDAWGFAARPEATAEAALACAREAVAIARHSAPAASRPVDLGEAMAATGSYRTPVRRDPFTGVTTEEKVLALTGLTRTLGRGSAIRAATASGVSLQTRTLLCRG